MNLSAIGIATTLVLSGSLAAQEARIDGEPRIIEMANIFARGFYEMDPAAPQSVIHPEISKIGIEANYWNTGRDVIEELSPGDLLVIASALNRSGRIDADTAAVGVDFFDQTETVGVIQLTADRAWYDFFLATRINDEWVFVNCAYGNVPDIPNPNAEADSDAIESRMRDYIDGYYDGDVERALSGFYIDADRRYVERGEGTEYLQPQTMEILRQQIVQAGETGRFANSDPANVRVIGLTRTTGAVRIDADGWTEWLFLQRLNDEWQVVNSFWEAS